MAWGLAPSLASRIAGLWADAARATFHLAYEARQARPALSQASHLSLPSMPSAFSVTVLFRQSSEAGMRLEVGLRLSQAGEVVYQRNGSLAWRIAPLSVGDGY